MFRTIVISVAMAVTLLTSGSFARAEPKVPSTPEEHFALAKQYKEKADGYRKEAADHRQMAEAYKNSVANAQDKRGQKNPFVVKMEKHCNALATAADKLATENDKAADYHTFRGKELQGK
jgi:hypothetical protein